MGEVNRDLNGRRGRVLGMDTDGDMQIITAHVPQAELFNVRDRAALTGPGSRLVHGRRSTTTRTCRGTSPRRSSRSTARTVDGSGSHGATVSVTARRRSRARAVLAAIVLLCLVTGCGRATPSSTGPTSTSVADDAAATCTASALGATTAAPVKPGPTSMGLPSLPQEGDLPMGRYSFSPLLTIDAPCWRRLPSALGEAPLVLARSDVPTDRLTVARAYRQLVDPCDPISAVAPDVLAIAAWFRALPGVIVEDRPSVAIDGRDATVVRLTATAAGGCCRASA